MLNGGNNSEVIELARNHLVVLRLLEHRPEGLRPLDEVRGAILSALRLERSSAMAAELASSVKERIQSGEQAADIAKAEQLEWNDPALFQRDSKGVDAQLLKELFKMPHPSESAPLYLTTKLPNGDSAVVALMSVTQPEETVAKSDVDPAKQIQVERGYADAAMEGVMQYLRNGAEISVIE